MRQWLLAVLEIADNDPWRARLRQAGKARTEGNEHVVEQLAREVDVRTQPPSFLLLAARSVSTNKQVRLALFRRIQHAYPADLWANHDLAFELIADRRYAEAVRYFTAALALRPENAGIYLNRGSALNEAGEVDASIADYRRAIALEPNFAMAHAMLGDALGNKKQWDAAWAECNEALRLNPKLPQAWGSRGRVHQNRNRFAQSIADHTQAIKLDPKLARSYVNRSNAYNMLQQYEKALADSTEAIRLDPMDHLAHGNHAYALDGLDRREDAITAYREAIRLKENYPEGHTNLGVCLGKKGDLEGAIREHRTALGIDKNLFEAHNNLGVVLMSKGQLDEAITEYREALRSNKDSPEAHANLGIALRDKGQLNEAIAEFKEALRIKKDFAEARQDLLQAEQMARIDARFPAVLEGKDQPKDATERLAFAELCQLYRKHYTAAVRFFGEAFAADPKLAENLGTGHRYNAACAAALAGCGQGKDADKLDDKERARLRRQALDWLRADREAWSQWLNKEPDKVRPLVIQQMRHWLQDPDFAGVRALEALAKLPEAEREPWRKLWDDIANTLAQAQAKTTPEKKSGP